MLQSFIEKCVRNLHTRGTLGKGRAVSAKLDYFSPSIDSQVSPLGLCTNGRSSGVARHKELQFLLIIMNTRYSQRTHNNGHMIPIKYFQRSTQPYASSSLLYQASLEMISFYGSVTGLSYSWHLNSFIAGGNACLHGNISQMYMCVVQRHVHVVLVQLVHVYST